MAANCVKRASLLVAICLCAMVNQAEASLQTQLNGESHAGVELVTTIASSIEISGRSSATLDEQASSGGATAEEIEAQRRAQILKLPGIADESPSSSAATNGPTDGGSVVPPFLSHQSVLPGELEVGTVVAMKAMIPPEPPPSGLLKPPRAES